MTLITWFDNKPLFRDGFVATEQECCCQRCCGIPANCTLTFYVNGEDFVYDHETGDWVSATDPTYIYPFIDFGGCQEETMGTGDPKYRTCCLSGSFADIVQQAPCQDYSTHVYIRIKCGQCCDTDPVTAVGCTLVDEHRITFMAGDCEQYIPSIGFRMVCEGEECNEFP